MKSHLSEIAFFIVLACHNVFASLALRGALTPGGDFACYWLCECFGAFAITVSHLKVSSSRNGEQFSKSAQGRFMPIVGVPLWEDVI